MDKSRFLQLMSMLESSGGKNTNHKRIKHGIHAGDKAIGEFGLMPNTIEEFQRRAKLKKMPIPQGEQEVADMLESHLSAKTQDPDKKAYMWQYGHNLDPNKIDEQMLEKNERVRRFRELQRTLGIQPLRGKPMPIGMDEIPLDILNEDEYNA